MFSGPPYALLHVWGSPERPMKPCAVASDSCGVVYIVDRLSRTVLRVRRDGEWLPSLGEGTLKDPVSVAVAPDLTVAVVDGRGVNAAIVVFPPKGGHPVRLPLVSSPLSLAFDDSSNLYAGTGGAIISKLEQDSTQLSGWSLGGDGVSDYDGGGLQCRVDQRTRALCGTHQFHCRGRAERFFHDSGRHVPSAGKLHYAAVG